jgi:hypothetical protein
VNCELLGMRRALPSPNYNYAFGDGRV